MRCFIVAIFLLLAIYSQAAERGVKPPAPPPDYDQNAPATTPPPAPVNAEKQPSAKPAISTPAKPNTTQAPATSKESEGRISGWTIFGIIVISIIFLAIFSSPTKCGICGNELKRSKTQRTVKGKKVVVCAHCNSALEKEQSKEAIRKLKG